MTCPRDLKKPPLTQPGMGTRFSTELGKVKGGEEEE